MENNTLISHELEQMRSQIGLLKDKLEKQTIINEQHILKSMRSKMSDINKTVTATIFLGVFALLYCTWFFHSQGYSLAFLITTAVILSVCLGLTIGQRINLGRIDFTKGNLVETAMSLSKIRTHYQHWHKIAIPMMVLWFGWFIYEVLGIYSISSSMAVGLCIGATVGGLIGGFFGFRINRKIVNKATEILEQIEELQRES